MVFGFSCSPIPSRSKSFSRYSPGCAWLYTIESRLRSDCLKRSRLAMSGSRAPERTTTPTPTRPMMKCPSTSILPLLSWSFISPDAQIRTSAGSELRRLSSCGAVPNVTLTRLPVSRLNCSAIFAKPGSTALSTLMSSAKAVPAIAHDSNAATTFIPDLSLVDARRHEQRLALGTAEIAHEDPGKLGIRGGRRGRGRVGGVVLHLGRQRPHQFQALLAVLQDFGDRPEADLPAFALEHVLHDRSAVGVARDSGLQLLVDPHFLEQVLEVNAAGGAVEHDRFGLQHRALERFAAGDVRHRRAGPDRHAQPHAPDVDAVRCNFARPGEFIERGGRRDYDVECIPAADALAYLGGGVERDIHLVAGLLPESGGRGSEPGLDCACAQHLDLSRHGRTGDRAQQQCRPVSHLRLPKLRKLPQPHSARAPENARATNRAAAMCLMGPFSPNMILKNRR